MSEHLPLSVVSLNVGLPRSVRWKNRTVVTGIFKEPVAEPVLARRLNLDGDRQADLTVHGGAEKAIYDYPAEHYVLWQQELGETILPWGAFGENLTTSGLTEEGVYIGQRFRLGEAILVVTQPRQPCYKLGVKFGRDDIVRRFAQSRRTGWYFAVQREGVITAGDQIVPLDQPHDSLSVAAVADLLFEKKPNVDYLRIAATLPSLAEGLRRYFQEQLDVVDYLK